MSKPGNFHNCFLLSTLYGTNPVTLLDGVDQKHQDRDRIGDRLDKLTRDAEIRIGFDQNRRGVCHTEDQCATQYTVRTLVPETDNSQGNEAVAGSHIADKHTGRSGGEKRAADAAEHAADHKSGVFDLQVIDADALRSRTVFADGDHVRAVRRTIEHDAAEDHDEQREPDNQAVTAQQRADRGTINQRDGHSRDRDHIAGLVGAGRTEKGLQ